MKTVYLLDTNIVSEFSKERPNQQVLDLFNARRNICAISAVTWQELIYGVSKMSEGKRKLSIYNFLQDLQKNMNIIPYDDSAAQMCGQIQSKSEEFGKKLPVCDSQIAATALANGMVLVTHNTTDFSPIAEKSFLKMEDWFN